MSQSTSSTIDLHCRPSELLCPTSAAKIKLACVSITLLYACADLGVSIVLHRQQWHNEQIVTMTVISLLVHTLLVVGLALRPTTWCHVSAVAHCTRGLVVVSALAYWSLFVFLEERQAIDRVYAAIDRRRPMLDLSLGGGEAVTMMSSVQEAEYGVYTMERLAAVVSAVTALALLHFVTAYVFYRLGARLVVTPVYATNEHRPSFCTRMPSSRMSEHALFENTDSARSTPIGRPMAV